MVNKQNNTLFQLIKTLNKGEKRNFKLYATRNTNSDDLIFLQLFNALDKMLEYDEVKLLKKNSSLKKSQLSNMSAVLYKQILSSLRVIKDEQNIDIFVREQIDFAKILLNKGLYLQSLHLLDKVKKTANLYNLNTHLSQIIFLEKNIELQFITRSIDNRADDLINESKKVINDLKKINDLSNLSLSLYSWYIKYGHSRTKDEKNNLQKIFNDKIFNADTKSFYQQLHFEESYSWYCFINLDFIGYYKHAQSWVNLFNRNETYKYAETMHYLKGLHNLLNALFFLKQYEKYLLILNELEILHNNEIILKNYNHEILTFTYLYTGKINYYFIAGEFTNGLHLIPIIEKKLSEFELFLDKHRILVFYYKIASLYFGSGHYNESIDYLNKIIHWKVDLRTDLQCYSRLLHLIAHYEMGNYDLIEYLLKSVYRFMAKMKNMSVVETKIFEFLRSSFKLNKKDLKIAFENLLVKIKMYEKNKKEARTFVYLDVVSWLESKIEGVAVEKIIRKKFLAQNTQIN